uniref:Endonuclease/exonuclease/phosphatase domain-containing protein n=1 Tax=viral metagenome TaxID=1070528 RepID=A0A6C0IJR9_9ZZZZ
MIFSLFFLLSLFVGTIMADTECPIVTSSGDRRQDKNKLRLVQYNAEWLFIDYYSSANCPGSGCSWSNASEAQTHMSYVTKVIHDLNPDIINFCEIEGCDELNMVKSMLNDATYTPYLKKGTDSATGQNVGMLTRIDPLVSLYRTEEKYDYPIQGSQCGYTGSGSTGVSKHYITEFKLGNMNVAFIAAHLLAIPTESSRCAQREGQASVLQPVIADYISRKYEVIILGDLNDFDGEVLDVNNNKPTSQVLNILKGNFGEYAGKYELTSVAESVTQSERYSDWYDSDDNCNTQSSKDYSMIDHVLVSQGVLNKIDNVFFYHAYPESCVTYNSDHYPVVIDFIDI